MKHKERKQWAAKAQDNMAADLKRRREKQAARAAAKQPLVSILRKPI